MRCRRCQGLMVWDRFIDLAQTDLLWAFGWRCVNCGEVLDAVILSHRGPAGTLPEPTHKEAQPIAIKRKRQQPKTMLTVRPLTRKRSPRREQLKIDSCPRLMS
jgi:hypothetical protein